MHNLRNVDVDIPRGKLVVVTGVSGSGKSALIFDTLFAESQRRFLDSLSTYSRQFVGQLQRPEVDTIDGLPPAIAVDQRTRSFSIRSTLSTQTEIHDFLRLLYARAGVAHCPNCSREVGQQSVEAIVRQVLAFEDRQKVMILSPLVRGRKGLHREVFERIAKQGFVRARVDGDIVDAAEPPELKAQAKHTIEAVVDRIIVKEGIESRLRESIDLAVRESDGTCLISHQDDGEWIDRLYSTKFACPDCELSYPSLELRSFSFNSPYGACSECKGLGVIADDEAENTEEDVDQTDDVCAACAGDRLAPFPNAVTIASKRLAEVSAMSVADASDWFGSLASDLNATFSGEELEVAKQTVPDVVSRLGYLNQVGLGYLTLARNARSLSGGEFQRARLARCLGSGLTGACYILDEPTVGLHPRDTRRLIESLVGLRDQGNSVIVVEHDSELLHAADHVIDIGPGAGQDGGRLLATGSTDDVAAVEESATGAFLRRELVSGTALAAGTNPNELPEASAHPLTDETPAIRIVGATHNNLKNVSAEFPHKALTCVTGVSGSGKSSLIIDTLCPIARAVINRRETPAGLCKSVTGLDEFQRVLDCDARPIGKTGRANPATYSGLWTEIRKLFAMTREARIRGFTARRFSFNVKEGNCPECKGQGVKRVQMKFMPDIFVPCHVCRGARFNRQTLSIRFNGKTVADVLGMRIDEATEHFRNFDRIHRVLSTFCDIGLGYLGLGQPAHTLSGGEAQRVKLATALGQTTRGSSLFILDEPTNGLHAMDVHRLLIVLRRLVGAGHTVVVIEHNTELIAAADWIVDLGPEAGERGGTVVAMGTAAEIRKCVNSHTGRSLV